MRNRARFFQLRLTEDERVLWRQVAEQDGFDSVSSMVRHHVSLAIGTRTRAPCTARVKKGAFCKKCGQTH